MMYLLSVAPMRYDDDMAKTMTELEVFELKMGRSMTEEDVYNITGKRYREGAWDRLVNSPHIYKRCDICTEPFCVNNWPDSKPRTPKFKNFVVCPSCDPRAVDDRHTKTGYHIMFPARLHIIRYAQITRAVANHGCLKYGSGNFNDRGCKCAGCAAQKLLEYPE